MFRVGIAEDEYYVQKSIEARIHALHRELEIVGIVETGVEAEALYDSKKPDIFFVDIHMPQCSGMDFIEKIREKDPQSRTVFIIISGYSDYENMRRAITAGVFDYLKKPIVPEEFVHLVDRAIARLENENAGEGQPVQQEQETAADEAADTTADDRLEQICSYIEQHYREKLSAKSLGDIFYLSPSYISHYFKKKKGLSLGKYIEEIRLEKAAEMLLKTDRLIADIAEQAGYEDGNYFTKVFRKKYKMPPGEYKKWKNSQKQSEQ